jgi:hypothetical protein
MALKVVMPMLLATVPAWGCLPSEDLAVASARLVENAGGAMSCDFDLPVTMNPLTIAPIIERDRMYMAARPGMRKKHIPFSTSVLGLRIQTGGRYLFDTADQAAQYLDWVRNDFVLDGVRFLERPEFLSPVCRSWKVVGAEEFTPSGTTHYFMRTERFRAPATHTQQKVAARWIQVRDEAQRRGLSGVRLNYDHQSRLVEIIHLADRALFDLLGLESLPTLGLPLLEDGCSKNFDRTQFVLTIWYPFVAGDHGPPAPFPNSPPLPGPLCLDGVCEVSRGETGASCPLDCPPACGDAVCQANQGETTKNCPGDCRLE